MVAVRLIPEEGKQWVIEVHLDVPLFHLPPELRPRVARAERVGEDAHGDAAPGGGREGFDERAAGRVVLEDVRLEEDFALGGRDRIAHRGERGGAVEEHRDRVAPMQRCHVDPLEEHLESRIAHPESQGLRESPHARGLELAGQHAEGHGAQDGPQEPRRPPPVLLPGAA